jgi:hypothetical protein
MTAPAIREQLHKQIDSLPDEIVQQIADFTSFLMAKQNPSAAYSDWDSHQWQAFALEQLFREEDDVEYSLDDAQEIYRP